MCRPFGALRSIGSVTPGLRPGLSCAAPSGLRRGGTLRRSESPGRHSGYVLRPSGAKTGPDAHPAPERNPTPMQALSNMFSAIAGGVRQVVGLGLPVFAKATDFRRWNPWVWRILHLLFLAAVLVLMWWLNRYYQFEQLLHQKVPIFYRQFFLPALFLVVYALSWLGYWLWRLLGEE